MEFTLLGAALLGVAAMYSMLWWEGHMAGGSIDRKLLDTAVAAGLIGLFVGRLSAMIADGVNPITNPADVMIIRGGVATGPASLAALLYVAVSARRNLGVVADGLSAAALAGLAGWHAGCLFRGACLGTQSDLPWAVAQAGSPITRHPVEIYAAVLFAAAAVSLALWKARGKPPSSVPAGIAIAAAGTIRLATQPLRPALSTGPVPWYVAAIVFGVAVAVYGLTRAATQRTPR